MARSAPASSRSRAASFTCGKLPPCMMQTSPPRIGGLPHLLPERLVAYTLTLGFSSMSKVLRLVHPIEVCSYVVGLFLICSSDKLDIDWFCSLFPLFLIVEVLGDQSGTRRPVDCPPALEPQATSEQREHGNSQ